MARLSGAGPEATQRQPSRTPSRSASVEQPDAPDENSPPFFNTTFSTHRVSPLYVGPRELDTKRLDELAGRLRDTLVGDVVRGVQIGLESTETGRGGQVGPLKEVRFRWFRAADVLGEEGKEERTARGKGKKRAGAEDEEGLWIHIRHENAAYNALMLPAGGGSRASGWTSQPFAQGSNNSKRTNEKHFVQLPLLLLRMPQPLKLVISEWIASTFDCRVSKVTLGTRTLVNVWESWIRVMGILSKGPDFVITLAFTLPTSTRKQERADGSDSEDELNQGDEEEVVAEPGLRSIDVTINPQDLRRFARAGENLTTVKPTKPAAQTWESDPRERRVLAGPNTDDGWSWRSTASARADQPFIEALARYLQHHLALDMFHPGVKVVQISCGGFVLAQSRLKVVRVGGAGDEVGDQLSRGAWDVVMRLGERVGGDGLPEIFGT